MKDVLNTPVQGIVPSLYFLEDMVIDCLLPQGNRPRPEKALNSIVLIFSDLTEREKQERGRSRADSGDC
jgi:hypothetical protein